MDGAFDVEWTTMRNFISHQEGLENIPGKSEMDKLKTWAESESLLMDFELEEQGFTTGIRRVTFFQNGWVSPKNESCQSMGPEERFTDVTGEVLGDAEAVHAGAGKESFDCDVSDWR